MKYPIEQISDLYTTPIPLEYARNTRLFINDIEPLNIGSKSSDEAAAALSNFAPYEFELDGVRYATVEAFLQSLKAPEADRARFSAMEGREAKKAGNSFKSALQKAYVMQISDDDSYPETPEGVSYTYKGADIEYRSPEHYHLLERAIRAKFEQNPEALQHLVGPNWDDRREITHNLSDREDSPVTSLPREVFCSILMKLRDEQQRQHQKEHNHATDSYGTTHFLEVV